VKPLLSLLLCLALPCCHLTASELRVSYSSVYPMNKVGKLLSDAVTKIRVVSYNTLAKLNSHQKEILGDALMVSSAYLDYHPAYRKVGQFQINNKNTMRYALISLSKKWNVSRLSEARVGIVDEVGRRNVKAQVKKLFSAHGKRHKRAGAPAELVPMLVLDVIDVAVIREDHLQNMKQVFKIEFQQIALSTEQELPVLCISKDSPINVVQLLNIPKAVLQEMGFSALISSNENTLP
jgi:hypothetical protein